MTTPTPDTHDLAQEHDNAVAEIAKLKNKKGTRSKEDEHLLTQNEMILIATAYLQDHPTPGGFGGHNRQEQAHQLQSAASDSRENLIRRINSNIKKVLLNTSQDISHTKLMRWYAASLYCQIQDELFTTESSLAEKIRTVCPQEVTAVLNTLTPSLTTQSTGITHSYALTRYISTKIHPADPPRTEPRNAPSPADQLPSSTEPKGAIEMSSSKDNTRHNNEALQKILEDPELLQREKYHVDKFLEKLKAMAIAETSKQDLDQWLSLLGDETETPTKEVAQLQLAVACQTLTTYSYLHADQLTTLTQPQLAALHSALTKAAERTKVTELDNEGHHKGIKDAVTNATATLSTAIQARTDTLQTEQGEILEQLDARVAAAIKESHEQHSTPVLPEIPSEHQAFNAFMESTIKEEQQNNSTDENALQYFCAVQRDVALTCNNYYNEKFQALSTENHAWWQLQKTKAKLKEVGADYLCKHPKHDAGTSYYLFTRDAHTHQPYAYALIIQDMKTITKAVKKQLKQFSGTSPSELFVEQQFSDGKITQEHRDAEIMTLFVLFLYATSRSGSMNSKIDKVFASTLKEYSDEYTSIYSRSTNAQPDFFAYIARAASERAVHGHQPAQLFTHAATLCVGYT